MWLEMTALQIGKGHVNRIKRGWLFGQWVPESSATGAGYESGGGGGGGPSGAGPSGGGPSGGAQSSVPQGPVGGGGGGGQQYGQAAAGYQPVVAPEAAPVCCTCHQGPPGPAGPEGEPGLSKIGGQFNVNPFRFKAKMERMETMERTGTMGRMPKHCLRHQRSHALYIQFYTFKQSFLSI